VPRVGHLTLYRSHLSPRGARYEAVDRFRLGG
jgi:2'-5' RNA ligase